MSGHASGSSVRRMQEALRGAAVGEFERARIAQELHARVRRLRRQDARFSAVALSRHVEESSLSVMTA